ncbi:MAG TPA: YezD family protein [Verrucomicrobiae bacterium]|jgi:hypothetical protein|nr:YezD family protein [Verrucomicrobiae bacterium]
MNTEKSKTEAKAVWLEIVRKQVAPLCYGVVQITVHDGRVVQVETTERLRFDKEQPEA